MKNIKLQRKNEYTAKKETKQKTNLKPKYIYKKRTKIFFYEYNKQKEKSI